MKIRISGLDNGTYTYDFEGDINDIDWEEPLYDRYKTEIVLTKFDDQMILEASTVCDARFICDRCGIDYHSSVESNYKMVYLFRNVEDSKEEADITYLSPDTVNINIRDDVRDYLILAVPMKKLCKEDCKGLCYKCGTDLNKGSCDCTQNKTDYRWNKLLELKNKFNTN
jgi:uncharacterized protein